MKKKHKHKYPEFKGRGLFLVDKAPGWTSHDVVAFVRSRFNIPKVGHCGTLDPSATGLLILLIGQYTKFSSYFSGKDKVYQSTLLLGTETDTQDLDGEVLSTKPCNNISESEIRSVFESFTGEIEQVPPMFSALKKNGKKLHELARKGKKVEREARPIRIHSIKINEINIPEVNFTVHCSKGTYVRTLCSDIGEKLECGGTLKKLRRIRSGELNINDAVNVEKIKSWNQNDFRSQLNKTMKQLIETHPAFNSF